MKRYNFSKRNDNLESIQKKLDALEKTIDFNVSYKDSISIKNLIYHMLSKTYLSLDNKTHTIDKNTKKKYKQVIGSTRSIEDMYLLCKTYIPNVKLKDIVKTIKQNNDIRYVRYCEAHKKYMYTKAPYGSKYIPPNFLK